MMTDKMKELVDYATKRMNEMSSESTDFDEKMAFFEAGMLEALDIRILPPPVGRVGAWSGGGVSETEFPKRPGRWLTGDDPRLPKMPEKPTLIDFFHYRFMLNQRGGNHLLQSAALAMEKGRSEKVILACLLHDISMVNLIRTDHGHWAAQMIAPYVDEEVTWAVKHHSAMRYRPDPEIGYEYPHFYPVIFGEDYVPPAHVQKEWEYCVNHPWYRSTMEVCINDHYAFDPDKKVDVEQFAGIIERNFRQPPEGLGFDDSPSAHMWRTLIWPNNVM